MLLREVTGIPIIVRLTQLAVKFKEVLNDFRG
jgi:hypothetical protein